MTRDTDTFIPLEERREFAERHQAALFMAIHADYTARASARGATIYSLRPQMADTLRRSAQGGVDDSVLSGKDVALVQTGQRRCRYGARHARRSRPARARPHPRAHQRVRALGDQLHGRQHQPDGQPGSRRRVRGSQDGEDAVDPDRARLHHQRRGCPAAEVRPVARQGLRIDRDGRRQLFHPAARGESRAVRAGRLLSRTHPAERPRARPRRRRRRSSCA